MKPIYLAAAVAMFVFSILVGILGLYMSGNELWILYFKTGAYHALANGHGQDNSVFLGTLGFLAGHLLTSLFTIGVVLMIASFFLWRLASKLWVKVNVRNA